MHVIPGYTITKILNDGKQFIVYRGMKEEDKCPVILKILKAEYPLLKDIARLRHEYDIIANLAMDGIAKPYGLEPHHHGLMLVLEDFGDLSLKEFMAIHTMDVTTCLKIAIELADILGALHQNAVIHKDIQPHNILIDTSTYAVKLTNFGLASRLSRETQAIRHPNVLEGTLAYISPEQTGRMNRSIDYRTDLYSLGVTFYEMLTGEVPFPTTDLLELVHCHIAKLPTPPHERHPEIPHTVSAIVMKLLAKAADDRYKSAYGLKVDLEACLAQWTACGSITTFVPGQHDVSDRFHIPQQLYGRDAELATLMTAFDRVSQGASELMLVYGYSGIGKSTLVNEIHKPIVQQRGYFVFGKFDQFKRDLPYSAFLQAFQELVRQLLTEGEDQIAVWRAKLSDALGTIGQVIVDVIPEIELIIGKQPPVPTLGPAETQNRFRLVFRAFINVFAQKQRPLTIFIDDLQWADSASLNLIRLLMTDASSQCLLMIGAYRDNEVSPTHALMFTLEEIEKGGGTVNRIALSALPMPDLSRLVADTLFSDTVRVKALTELVFQKTAGNPFFVIEFLKALYHAQLLTFDVSRGAWQWDVEHIHAMQMTDNVVDLMSSKIQKLAVDTQSVIKFAACIGNQVDLKTLAVVCERSPFETASILWEAIQEGLILPLDETYGFLQESKLDDNATPLGTFEDFTVVYAFVHDRVQQAAYSLIPEAEKKETHLKVGRLLLSHIEADALEDRLFEIVNHLNFSAELIGHQAERDELAQLNLRAGKKAKASTAYGPALRYCTVGTDLLNPDSWEAQYDLTFALYMERAECEYLTTHFSPAEALFDFILKHAKTTMDQVAVYSTRLTLLAHVGQFKEAVDAGLTGLRLLKLHLPAAPSKATLLQEFLKIKWYQGRRKVEDLEQLPNRMSPRERAAINILANLWGPSFWLNQNLNGVIVLYMLNLTLRYGNSDVSPIAYVCYGMLLSAVFGDAKTGYKFGTLALKLAKQFNNPYVTGKVLFVFATFLGTYRLHNTENLDFYKESLQYCLETGDLVYAGFCTESIECTMPLSGYTLDSLHLENQKYLDLTRRIGREGSFVVCQAMQRWLAKLQGSDDRCDFNHIFQQEDKYPMETGIYYLYELQLLYVFEHYHDAMQVITRLQANPIIKGHPVHVGFFYLYYALTLASLYPTAAMTDKRQYRKTLRANQRKLKKWAEHCPENFLHMYMLASAEMARVFGHDRQAERLYEQAIEAARTYAYIQYEASANELAAKYYLAQGRPQIAKTYLMEARYGYLKWGAHAKRQALDTQYAHLLGHTAATREPAEGVTHTTTLSDASQLDLTTVTKALQAVSGEIVLEQLLKRLMSTAIGNAGAQKAFLILEKAGQFVIEAATTGGPDEVTVLQATPVAACPDVSAAIVNYVLRTRDHVVLHDAANEGIFIGDPYIRHNQPKSIMCAPLINQGKLTGVLYLENNLTAGAFTPDRLEVLHLLSSQSAISIENASLYNNLQEANAQLEDYSRTLEHRVAERTQELHEKNLALEIANQHIIAATERKTQFFNNMSHELRTPLDAIIGFSEVLQEQTFGPLTPRQDEYVNYVLTSGTHLLSLINDLLDLAKLDARMMELQRDTFPLQPLLERSLVMVQERAAERSITLSLEVADDLDTVTADARRVQQIMLNLLSNAVKFTPDHGSVGITATQAGDRVRIAVWDTGVGIAPEDQQRIFEEFQQIGDTRATKTAGTGLGLALTRKFVELHGGTIEVESRPGQGSTFTVFLPITGDAPQA